MEGEAEPSALKKLLPVLLIVIAIAVYGSLALYGVFFSSCGTADSIEVTFIPGTTNENARNLITSLNCTVVSFYSRTIILNNESVSVLAAEVKVPEGEEGLLEDIADGFKEDQHVHDAVILWIVCG